MNSPIFFCYWGEGHGLPTREFHTLDWFTPDCGYSHADIWRMSELEINEQLNLTDISGQHFVVRVS